MLRRSKANNENRLIMVDEGIEISPIPVTQGDSITIKYNGQLAKNGADTVYAHVGYGTGDDWHNIQDIAMMSTKDGWVCNTSATEEERLHFCFHDSAHNWDNNEGRNWSITVHNG